MQLIKELKAKYNLVDFTFDTECIDNLGDLSDLLKGVLEKSFPEKQFTISEEVSIDKKHYISTIKYGNLAIQIQTDTHSDWLSDEALVAIENLPRSLKIDKMYYSINPAIGLTGQEAWFFAGTDEDLKRARKDGLPLIFPGENIFETEEFKKYNQ